MDVRAFQDELELIHKEKVAIDPITAASLGAGGKIMLANLLQRHGMRIPGVRRVIQRIGAEAAGFGARAGASGQPMISKPIRELVALGVDPHLVKAYEGAYQAGQKLGPIGLLKARGAAKGLQQELKTRAPDIARAIEPELDIIRRVNLAPAKADVLHMPVGEAAKTIGRGVKEQVRRLRPASAKLREAVKRDASTPPHRIGGPPVTASATTKLNPTADFGSAQIVFNPRAARL